MSTEYNHSNTFDGKNITAEGFISTLANKSDLICFSHLRWDFVHQRPQHLLNRAAANRRVFFVEEPIFDNGTMKLHVDERDNGVRVVTPHLPAGLQSKIAANAVLAEMVQRLISSHGIHDYVLWYYTPMALPFTSQLNPRAVIYDCMDELSAFKNAPEDLGTNERELFNRADLVFTGGQSLYDAKREQHHSVHCFPSSIDWDHFYQARTELPEPLDQRDIPHPRLGFFGVIDERLDINLLDGLAKQHPDWHFVMVGPIVKVDPASLPAHSNIHYLGAKSYQDLPAYISGWDVALLLFARNDATRFISPTKTPEYLAAGKPVVSTSIRDVVKPYGEQHLVAIADDVDGFGKAIAQALIAAEDPHDWLTRVDKFLDGNSWNNTWSRMESLIDRAVNGKQMSAGSTNG